MNLLDLNSDFKFVSSDRQAMLSTPDIKSSTNHTVQNIQPSNDVLMDIDDNNSGAHATRQAPPSNANPIHHARAPTHAAAAEATSRAFDNYASAPSPSRQLKPLRSRNTAHRTNARSHYPAPRRVDRYIPHYHADDSNDNANVDRYSLRRRREDSPETVRQKALGKLVAAMADVDIKKEEGREDRRERGGGGGGGGQRGGNNKRRRDGELRLCGCAHSFDRREAERGEGTGCMCIFALYHPIVLPAFATAFLKCLRGTARLILSRRQRRRPLPRRRPSWTSAPPQR